MLVVDAYGKWGAHWFLFVYSYVISVVAGYHATPSLGMMALMAHGQSASSPTKDKDAPEFLIPCTDEAHPQEQNQDSEEERVYPGAVAVKGIDDEDDFTFSPSEDENEMSLISARLVTHNETVVEVLQERVEQQEEQLRQQQQQLQTVLTRETPAAQVIARNEDFGNSLTRGTNEAHGWFANGPNSSLSIPRQTSNGISKRAISSLREEGYSRGLVEAMAENATAFPLRIWVIDNSGSMATSDGARLVETSTKNSLKYVQCTRWNELRETVKYHAEMAGLLQAPTVFRLLNDPGKVHGPQQFGIAERGEDLIDEDLEIARKCLGCSPGGMTPLSDHIRDIRENIIELEPTLKQNGTKVAIVLATGTSEERHVFMLQLFSNIVISRLL